MAKAAKTLANDGIASVSKRITTLEMKELNERQRAEHAQKMYEHMRGSLRQVEERNLELEAKFAQVSFRYCSWVSDTTCIQEPSSWATYGPLGIPVGTAVCQI